MLCGILVYNLFSLPPRSPSSPPVSLPSCSFAKTSTPPCQPQPTSTSQHSRLNLPNLLIPWYPQKLIHPCILLIPNPGRPIKILLDPRPYLVDSVEPEDHDATCHTRMRLRRVDRRVRVRGRTGVVGGDEGSAED